MEAVNMRTTIDLPEELLNEAMKVTGAKTKTMTICLALQELIRKKQRSTYKAIYHRYRIFKRFSITRLPWQS